MINAVTITLFGMACFAADGWWERRHLRVLMEQACTDGWKQAEEKYLGSSGGWSSTKRKSK